MSEKKFVNLSKKSLNGIFAWVEDQKYFEGYELKWKHPLATAFWHAANAIPDDDLHDGLKDVYPNIPFTKKEQKEWARSPHAKEDWYQAMRKLDLERGKNTGRAWQVYFEIYSRTIDTRDMIGREIRKMLQMQKNEAMEKLRVTLASQPQIESAEDSDASP